MTKDTVNSPDHYTAHPMEVIDMMLVLLDEMERRGIQLTYFQAHCWACDFKYRMRVGLKDEKKIIEDVQKALKYMEFRNKKTKKRGDYSTALSPAEKRFLSNASMMLIKESTDNT